MKEDINIECSEFSRFILEHDGCDTGRLLFSSARYPGIDLKLAAATIEARKKIKNKVPLWFGYPGLRYPTSLCIEQCSSQTAALYKQRFVPEGGCIADITGGLGIDCFFMSQKASKADYIERDDILASAAERNFAILGLSNIIVINCDSDHFLNKAIESGDRFDLIFADPARRSATASRIYSIVDCEPDILSLKDKLFAVSGTVLVKVSPMADISHTASILPECSEIHVVSVDNECKELLLLLKKGHKGEPAITAATLSSKGRKEEIFSFMPHEEKETEPIIAAELEKYIYIPDKALLKAGAFNLTASRFGLKKLAQSTHLYTSRNISDSFQGKIREIKEILPFSKASLQEIASHYTHIEPVAINFPMDTAELKKRLKTKDGGNDKLIATTLSNKEKVLIIC
jgi:SAM-dependent methyltransferases related to tRNA (uracil-5-)-methyltransferase